ncbi:protein of unknown function [Filimonas lacunae]|uniref:DUF4251 domain-containing protein n=1 Tax=Filimonas lacunae TaxID=477680 RepID=A0A173MIB0_9BACT|nr:DUF4251 domain-containing protein [Filimonas lacunae]BAV07207.1 hypothetical protein FLA_3230 [Filimonas lacunae]SIS93249.1 protein of unknown function [Filimonas lacunae]
MKTRLLPFMIGCLLMALPGARIIAQDSGKTSKKTASQTELAANIHSRTYLFQAQSATPMSGRVIQLTGGYEVKVKNDTVVVYLPYYGRAFQAPLDPTKGPLDFTSTQFKYTLTERKKGGWNILITPSDGGDVRQLSFTVSENGYTSLQVTSNNRQPISFYGTLGAIKKRK